MNWRIDLEVPRILVWLCLEAVPTSVTFSRTAAFGETSKSPRFRFGSFFCPFASTFVGNRFGRHWTTDENVVRWISGVVATRLALVTTVYGRHAKKPTPTRSLSCGHLSDRFPPFVVKMWHRRTICVLKCICMRTFENLKISQVKKNAELLSGCLAYRDFLHDFLTSIHNEWSSPS